MMLARLWITTGKRTMAKLSRGVQRGGGGGCVGWKEKVIVQREEMARPSTRIHLEECGEMIDLGRGPSNTLKGALHPDMISSMEGKEGCIVDLSCKTYPHYPDMISSMAGMKGMERMEGSTVDLSCATKDQLFEGSVLDQPLDVPYDSEASVGPVGERRAKYMSGEEVDLMNMGPECGLEDLDFMRTMYRDIETRFGIGIEGGWIDVVRGLEYQRSVMDQVQEFWRKSLGEQDEHMELFIVTYPSAGAHEKVEHILSLYRRLHTEDSKDRVSLFLKGSIPLVSLIDAIDLSVRTIIDQWKASLPNSD